MVRYFINIAGFFSCFFCMYSFIYVIREIYNTELLCPCFVSVTLLFRTEFTPGTSVVSAGKSITKSFRHVISDVRRERQNYCWNKEGIFRKSSLSKKEVVCKNGTVYTKPLPLNFTQPATLQWHFISPKLHWVFFRLIISTLNNVMHFRKFKINQTHYKKAY